MSYQDKAIARQNQDFLKMSCTDWAGIFFVVRAFMLSCFYRFWWYHLILNLCDFLTHFMSLVFFDTPGQHQKTRAFLCFQGVSKETCGMKWVNVALNIYKETLLIRIVVESLHFLFLLTSVKKCFFPSKYSPAQSQQYKHFEKGLKYVQC